MVQRQASSRTDAGDTVDTATSGRFPALWRLAHAAPEERGHLARSFQTAAPFPHLVYDDLLEDDDEDLLAAFDDSTPGWHRFQDRYQAEKRTFSDMDALEGPIARLLWLLNGPAFLSFLEDVTGIQGLIPDPYLKGGGLHRSGPGGVLAPHSDFHEYPRLRLFRRVNVLLYLNPGWQDDWGGALELYADQEAVTLVERVPARWGRMVIFRTDLDSVHGFTQPVPAGVVRRSVATYYYTADEATGYSGDTNTLWRRHDARGPGERAQLAVYRGLLRASVGLSYAAHAFNPSIRRARRAQLAPKD